MRLSKNLTNKLVLLLLSFTLVSCSSRELCKEDLINYTLEKENGLYQEVSINDELLVSCSYRDANLLFEHDTSYLNSVKNTYWFFKVSIEYIGKNEVDFLALSKIFSEQIVNSASWFSATDDDEKLIISNVQPVSYLGTVSRMEYLITILKPDNLNKEIEIEFEPKVESLGFLDNEFSFSKSHIDSVPSLKIGC